MAKVVVIGAGFAGQTAVLYLKKELGKEHEITMINPRPIFTYTPSLVWVGVGLMEPERATFQLAPVYRRLGIRYLQAYAREIHPDEQYVLTETEDGKKEKVPYDYLINATGPYLNFEGTPGLGPHEGTTHSICTVSHATLARNAYLEAVYKMEKGEKQRIVIGTGHGMSTCQGAAFEYITNIHNDLVRRGLRKRAELLWLSNEPALGDFGMGGIYARHKGKIIDSESIITSLFHEYGIQYQVQTAVKSVEKGKIYWENYEGETGTTPYDFAMLIPQFKGIPIKYIDGQGEDITQKMTNPAGFMIVDGTYGKSWMDLSPEDWPSTYQSPHYPNLFAAGIAFAPPGTVSKPHVTKNGTQITATPPRTGMMAGMIGKVVALNVVDMIRVGHPTHHESMSDMPGACIASVGKSVWNGGAATILMYPAVPDYREYPETGRNLSVNKMELGLAGAWIKRILHTMFIYKMKGNPGWSLIPE